MSKPVTRSIALVTALSAALVLGPSAAVRADDGSDRFRPSVEAAIDQIIADTMTTGNLPGMAVSIEVPGRGSYQKAYGVANVTTGAPFTLRGHLRIASITKTFTGTLILRLVDAGKLRLDDHLSEYVKGIRYGKQITIRQLLNMTAGVFSFTEDEAFGEAFDRDPLMPFTPADALAIVRRHKPDFPPGQGWHYSDSNYVLLQLIAERATGKSIADLMENEVIEPLGLDGTSYPTTPDIPRPRPHGYVAQSDGTLRDVTAVNPDVAGGAGAMISTLDDLTTYAKQLADGTILKPRTQRERLEFVDNNLSPVLTTGYGLGIFDIQGFVGHDGAIYGFSTAMFHLPQKDATIVVVGNQSTNFTTPSLDAFIRIAQLLFPGRFPPT
jgi:D-alanyl-D-alanine carboxypeptidase